jgi:hypothetical protein
MGCRQIGRLTAKKPGHRRIVDWYRSSEFCHGLQTMACHAIVSDDRYQNADHMQIARQNLRRSISASICLLMVVLLYAPLAGAAWSSYVSACCMSGQCPIAAHHHQKIPSAPANHMDCGHDMLGMMACAISCCHDSDRSLVTSIAFVLPPSLTPDRMVAIKSPIEYAWPLDFPRSVEPVSPPPRCLSSAV